MEIVGSQVSIFCCSWLRAALLFKDMTSLSDGFVKRSVSNSSDEEDFRDTEKPAGVRDWGFPPAEEVPFSSYLLIFASFPHGTAFSHSFFFCLRSR